MKNQRNENWKNPRDRKMTKIESKEMYSVKKIQKVQNSEIQKSKKTFKNKRPNSQIDDNKVT